MSAYEVGYLAIFLGSIRISQRRYQAQCQESLHPSLHFKCINPEENVWSVRIARGYRALGVLEGDTVTWLWIGSHDDYERFFS